MYIECMKQNINHLDVLTPCSRTFRPEENSTISSAWTFLSPYTRAIPSPMDSTRPVSSRSAPVFSSKNLLLQNTGHLRCAWEIMLSVLSVHDFICNNPGTSNKEPKHYNPKGNAFNNLSSAAMVWQCAGSLLQCMQRQHFWKPAIQTYWLWPTMIMFVMKIHH